MPIEPFRFIHAANLFLDHQLRGVGSVSDAVRDEVEKATLTAWNRIVEASIVQQVDFLLLAGNSFDATDHSLTGQVALIEGLKKLEEYDIPVFIAPGVADPDMAWRLGLALPENVVRFGGELSEPVVLSKNGRRFCTIHHVMANIRDLDASDGNGLDELAVFAPQFGPNEAGPFDIALLESVTNDAALPPELADSEHVAVQEALRGRPPHVTKPPFDPDVVARCPIEYWALGDGLKRQAWRVGRGIAHTPGVPQGLSMADTGILGCSLIEVDGDGQIRDSIIPTSRVRWEKIDLTLQAQATRESVLQQLRSAFSAIPRTMNDEIWLVDLTISGSGRLFLDLKDSDTCHRLWNEAVPVINGSQVEIILRRVRCSDPADELPGNDFLTQEFVRQVQLRGAVPAEAALRVLAESEFADSPWSNRLQAILPELDIEEVIQDSQRIGLSWLRNSNAG